MKAVEGGGLRDEGGVGEDGRVESESRREQSGTKYRGRGSGVKA